MSMGVCDKCEIVCVGLGCVGLKLTHLGEQGEGGRYLIRKWIQNYRYKIGYECLYGMKKEITKNYKF